MSRPHLARLVAPAVVALAASACSSDCCVPPPSGSQLRLTVERREAGGSVSLWEYRGDGIKTRLTADSLTLLRHATRATDGRMALVLLRPQAPSLDLVEVSAAGAVLRTIALPAFSMTGSSSLPSVRSLAYSPDGARLAWTFTASTGDSLYVLEPGATSAHAVAGRLPDGREGSGLVLPGARWLSATELAFPQTTSTIVAVNATTGAVRPLLELPLLNGQFTNISDYDVSSTGRIAVAAWNITAVRGVFVYEPGVQHVDSAAIIPAVAFGVRWAPDGLRLATFASGPSVVGGDPVAHTVVLQVLTPGSSAPPVVFGDVWLNAIHGWLDSGEIIVTGVPISTPGGSSVAPDVYLSPAGGGASRNLSQTPGIQESRVLAW